MYEMPLIEREDVLRFMAASAAQLSVSGRLPVFILGTAVTPILPIEVQNTADPEPYIFLRVIANVKAVFAKELVPLLARWLAHHVHDSYVMAFEVVLRERQFEHLRCNRRFGDIMRGVLRRLYNLDILEFLESRFLTRSQAFLERTCLERETRLCLSIEVSVSEKLVVCGLSLHMPRIAF